MFSAAPLHHFPLLQDAMPKHVDETQFVHHFDSRASRELIEAQMQRFREALPTAPLSSTHVSKGEGVVASTNPHTRNSKSLPLSLVMPEFLSMLDEAAQNAANDFSFVSEKLVPNQFQALAYEEGGFFVSHYDDSYRHKYSLWRNRPDRALTALLYLTDDYDGGELSFPRIVDESGAPLRVKPAVGTGVAFPPHAQYEHRVERVTRGLRVNISRWYADPRVFLTRTLDDEVALEAMQALKPIAPTSNLAGNLPLAALWGRLAYVLPICYGHKFLSAYVTNQIRGYNAAKGILTTLVPLRGSASLVYPNTRQQHAILTPGVAVQLSESQEWRVSDASSDFLAARFVSQRLVEINPELRPLPDFFSFDRGGQ